MFTKTAKNKLAIRLIIVRVCPLVVSMTAERVTALRVEIIQLTVRNLLSTTRSLSSRYTSVTVMPISWSTLEHFALHLINILLSVLDHLDCLLPLLDKCRLSLLDFLLLHLDPTIDLLLLQLESSW